MLKLITMIEQLVLAILIVLVIVPIAFVFKARGANLTKSLGLLSSYHIIYVAVLFLPFVVDLSIAGSSMNWTGKIFAIIFSLIFYFVIRKNFKRDFIAGEPDRGSYKKILIVGISVLATMCLLTVLFSKSKPLSIEKLAFQLSMPGFDEELWRGILIGLLILVIKETKFKFGHPVIWITAIIFALSHSLYFINWELGFAADAFIITGALGYMLGWMTLFSKSIMPALIFHNLINFATNGLEMLVI